MNTRLILRLDDPAARNAQDTGGKGASLARLTQAGFPVPDGFVVTTGAFRLCAAQPDQKVPAELRVAIDSALVPFPEDTAFAVRSSSTFEDLAGAAFAGQHDTFLNVRGLEAVMTRVRDCFASLRTERAIAYRAQNGFAEADATMAVVVQRLIPAEVAGVAFSVNPVSGDLTESVVDANFGLGESVVGGEAAVDHWELTKATGEVRRAVIADKRVQTVTTADGVRDAERTDPSAALPCLTEADLRALAELLRDVEQHAKFPQDIEWCRADGTFWLLQARPVTRIAPRWTRDESAERFPNTITPLTWDFVDEGFHRSLDVSFRMLGFPPCHSRWFALHDHYVYGDQNLVELYLRRPPFAPRTLDEVRAAVPELRERYRWVQELPIRWARDLDGYLLELGSLATQPLDELDARGVWDHALAIQRLAVRYFEPNIAISITQATLHRLLSQLTKLVAGPDADGLLEGLFAHGETKTAAINRELGELADLIRGDTDLQRLFAERESRDLAMPGTFWMHPAFADRFACFLKDHGHREMEFDMYAPPWGEAPWIVLDTIRLLAADPNPVLPALRERAQKIRQQEAELSLLNRTPEDLRYFLHEVIRLTHAYTALDDLEHYETMRLTPVFRRALRELGRRWQQQANLDDPMDVYFARRAQVEAALVRGTDAAVRELGVHIRKQKAAWRKDRARTPVWQLGLDPAPPARVGDLMGLPGSPGCAEGEVCLVHGPEDFARFKAGAVLVARTTSPSWTPLFYHAAAVITESGGPLSHGAVTAREIGIPAVMSVRGALSALEDGDFVEVNGTTGHIGRQARVSAA